MADVITLPTAATQPVRQVARRGRLPRQIGNVPRLRALKQMQALDERAAITQQRGADQDRVRSVLRGLLQRANGGLIDGMVLVLRHPDGDETCLVVGAYRRDWQNALAAAGRLSNALLEA
jgi:hypothetical protein